MTDGITIKTVFSSALDDLRAAMNDRMANGDWEGTDEHFESAKEKLDMITETLEAEQ